MAHQQANGFMTIFQFYKRRTETPIPLLFKGIGHLRRNIISNITIFVVNVLIAKIPLP
jgi:hypothetical protein